MKKIFPNKLFYSAIFNAYLDFIQSISNHNLAYKKYTYDYSNLKGVRQEQFKGIIDFNFKLLDKLISEQIYVGIKYDERSKKLYVAFKLKSFENFILTFNSIKNSRFIGLYPSFLDELVWSLIKTLVPIESPTIEQNDYFISPLIDKNTKYINPFNAMQINEEEKYFIDDVLTILYNIYQNRKNKISIVKISANDILFLRGNKKECINYRDIDRKRVKKAVLALEKLNLIKLKTLKRYEWGICVLENKIQDGFFIPNSILKLSPRFNKYSKYLGTYICSKIHKGKFDFRLKNIVDYILNKRDKIKPLALRELIEDSMDKLQEIKLIKHWQYKKIDENKLNKHNWLLDYKKLSIEFKLFN